MNLCHVAVDVIVSIVELDEIGPRFFVSSVSNEPVWRSE